jgi:dolichyl-phosphate-mannose--protein O-mannosyl transferase
MAAMPTTYADEPVVGDRAAETLARVRSRLVRPLPDDRLAGWLWPLAVAAVAGFLRFDRLSVPGKLVFDEVYYAKDSWSLLHHGVELDSNGSGPGFVVHPPLGKWMIAVGQWIFGHDSFGWRFSAAVVGTLSVLIVARVARRMFGSTLLGCVAGVLLALDGLAFVQSRIAMLDIFLMFWVLAAFAALVADRDDGRRRLAERLVAIPGPRDRGPSVGLRPWRWVAGFCLGAASATKWSGALYIVPFLVLAVAWDAGARRTAGVRRPWRAALLKDGLVALVPFLVVPAVVYVVSWTGWFAADARTAWDHDKYVHPGQATLGHVRAVWDGWIAYHREIYNFHAGLTSAHPYRSRPWGWLLLARPVSYFYSSPKQGQLGCTVPLCSKEVLGIGTPAIWWVSIGAFVWLAWRWVTTRDWRASAILLTFLAGYLPWFREDAHDRTMFLFYLLPGVPFMVLAIAMCIGLLLGGRAVDESRRRWVAAGVGGYLLLVVLNFGYLYPVLAAKVIPYDSWHNRMWFTSCANPNQKHEAAPCWI